MNEQITGTKIAERLLTRPEGATMAEIIAATGGPQYNVLKKLEALGYAMRRVKEGKATRYFAEPPAEVTFEAKITSNGQVTIPKEVRDHLGAHSGRRLRFTLEESGQARVTLAAQSILDLVGILPKPKRPVTIEEMDEGIRQAAAERYLRSTK